MRCAKWYPQRDAGQQLNNLVFYGIGKRAPGADLQAPPFSQCLLLAVMMKMLNKKRFQARQITQFFR